MTALRGLAWLLLLQTAGELLARGLSLPFPGPVVGMGLLFASLFSAAVREAVGAVAEFLLSHLSLLFVPVGVGAMAYVSLLSEHGLRIAVVIVLSLAPKSVTAPVAMGIAEKIGGIPALAAVFAVLTGLVGAISGKYLFALMRVPTTTNGWRARGFAMGTASHGIGAARALQVHPDAGAYAGLALGAQVVLASLLMPLVFWLLR
jgi:putative effector of murein hydrolase